MSALTARRRGREDGEVEGEHDQQAAAASQLQSADQAVNGTEGQRQDDPSAAGAQPPPQSAGVQPLSEQFGQRKKQRRSARLACHLDKLAVVELQLCLQFLDAKSKLMAARCSRRLLQAASQPFAWRSAPPFAVEVRSAADVERIQTSLLRFAPIHLRCVWLESLQCVAAVPHLAGLELLGSPLYSAADLLQLLQRPRLARLQTIRLDDKTSQLLSADAVRLIARLPQLRSLGMTVTAPFGSPSAALLRPLSDAPALTDLALDFIDWSSAYALMAAVGGCAGLRRMSLRHLAFPRGTFLALCSSPNMRRLQHLELADSVASDLIADVQPPDADEYQSAFSALRQLQSLALERVYVLNVLLPHLHRAPALRLLTICCQPNYYDISAADSPLPTGGVLSALLTTALTLEVRLLMPATLERWLELGQSVPFGSRALSEHQWRDLQRMAAELERVTIVDGPRFV